MSSNSLKPWSQVDEEPVEQNPAATSSFADATDFAAAARPSHAGKGRAMGGAIASVGGAIRPFLETRLRSCHAAYPLGIALLWTVYGAMTSGAHEGGLGRFGTAGVAACVCVALAILAQAWRLRRKAMADLHTSIARLGGAAPNAGAASLGAELAPLWKAVERQTAEVTRQLEQLMEERKELGLTLSMIEVQKGQVEAIVASLTDPLIVTDAYDQLIFVNKAAAELFNVSAADALRKPIGEVLGDGGLVSAIRQAREAEGRVARRRVDQEIGGLLHAMTMSPLLPAGRSAEAGERHGVVLTLRDVSKERQASKMKNEFVAQAAHELRTPLSSISAYVEMLVDGEAADEKTRREYYEIIQSSAQRLGRLIDNMLNISRIEAGTVRIKKEAIPISVVAREALDVIRPTAEERGLTLSEELPPVLYRVMADRDLIYQAILNLLSNAVKFTPSGGSVHLRMIPQEHSRTIRIEVRDSGVGIPKEDLPRMFEKFFRVEKSKQMAKGTGLGLPLVKQIVETVHDGELTLTSEEGVGSTFIIVLPLAEQNES